MKLSIIIPVYNEVNTVLEILRQVKAAPYDKEIIIVDDGSTDGTRELLEDIGDKDVTVIYNDKNRGKGFALRKGFEKVTGDIVITQDADLEYFPDEYAKAIEKIEEGKADVVYGTRFLGARRVFYFYHYIGNKVLNLIANILYNTYLSDFMTGFKVFRKGVISNLSLKANGFGIEAEITAQIFKRKYRVYEVPVSYNGRGYDEGKKITWKDFFASLWWLILCKVTAYDVGSTTLYRMRLMKNNNRWVFDRIKKYLGESILEVGAGIGNISRFIVCEKKKLIVSDISPDYLEYLKNRFIGNPDVTVCKYDLASMKTPECGAGRIDTVLCINVLEHIEDDAKALKNIHDMFDKDGRLILMVPAMPLLYGSLDKHLDHFRRYSKDELFRKVQDAGFKVEDAFYHNMLSAPGWFINSVILRRKTISSLQARLLDLVIPVYRIFEHFIKVPCGLSLIVICDKKV